MANTPEKPQMSDEERADLMAMIAAGRDLSPEMDKSLIDSYAEKRTSEQKAREKLQGNAQNNAVVPQRQNGAAMLAGVHPAVAITGIVVVAAVFITIMVLTHGWLWWLIFPLFGIFGGWWGNNDRNRIRSERRAQRYQMRADYYRARMGLPPQEDSRRLPGASESTGSDSAPLPPPTSAPTQPTPPAPRSVPPVTGSGSDQPPVNPAG